MSLKKTARNGLTSLLIVLQVAAFPSLAIAQEVVPEAPASESTSAPTAPAEEPKRGATNTGPTSPTGADSKSYTKNADGTWSNGKYTWDPNTKQTKPNQPQDYSYNPSTGRWDTKEYAYQPESGKYVANPNATANQQQTAQSSTAPQSAARATNVPTSTINGTGPNSNNTIGGTTNNTGTFDLFFNGAISNDINSNATSGDATVQGNTTAGSALTGNATAMANLLNMLQSSWLGSNSNVATFVNDINGNVRGDLLIDPSNLPYAAGSNNTDVDINVSNNGVIDNNIDLVSQSGNATVDSNTKGGDATSGNANAMANVINMINSAINANQSFMGMININGNLDGDILLPPGVLEALIANTGTNSTNTIGGNTNANVDINNSATRTVNNNVNTDAASGNAVVDSNTKAGNGTSGSVNSSINTMNLVGQNITGKNGLLVFVNVMGKWVGMVVGPSQSTASITNTGPDSNNQIGPGNSNQSITVNATENSLINNDINVAAQTGDATVSNNTEAGNATSGNANASVNLLNMIGSTVDVTDWFGVLFINVFGSWFGNFGSDTANGGFSQSGGATASSNGSTQTQVASSTAPSPIAQVFGFITRSNTATPSNGSGSATIDRSTIIGDDTQQNTTVLGASTDGGATNGANGQSAGGATNVTAPQANWWLIAGIIGVLATILVLSREYILALREERLANQ